MYTCCNMSYYLLSFHIMKRILIGFGIFVFSLIIVLLMNAGQIENYMQAGYNSLGQRTDTANDNAMVNPAQLVTTDLTAAKAQQSLRQPTSVDWTKITTNFVAFNAAILQTGNITPQTYIYESRMDFNKVNPSTFLSLGNIIRITQDGSYKYFYVVDIESDHIWLFGGSDYIFNSNTITDIAYSSKINPSGFPGYFTYSPTISNNFTMSAIYTGSSTLRLAMNGRVVTIAGSLEFTLAAPLTAIFGILPPFKRELGVSLNYIRTANSIQNSAAATTIEEFLGSTIVNPTLDDFDIENGIISPFAAGQMIWYSNLTYIY